MLLTNHSFIYSDKNRRIDMGPSINTLSLAEERYNEFLKKWKEIALLSHAAETLAWDQEVMMPKGEGETRAEQMAMFAEMIHQKVVDERLYDILRDLALFNFKSDHPGLVSANIREALKIVKRARALPADLVAALAKEASLAFEIW